MADKKTTTQAAEQAALDEEGMQIMRNLGHNMAGS